MNSEMEKELEEIGKQVSRSWFRPFDEALGMPQGSIRAILAIMVTLGTLLMFFFKVPVPEFWAVIVGIVLRDYFAAGATKDTSKLLNGK